MQIYKNMIQQFITENNINFEPGNRNHAVTTIIGYAQFLGFSELKLKKELSPQIEKDSFIGQEVKRLYKYCANKNYKAFWLTPDAKKQYKF